MNPEPANLSSYKMFKEKFNFTSGTNSVQHAQEIGFHFYKIQRQVMPECLLDKNIRVPVYRTSIVSEKMDSRQKHAEMTAISTEALWRLIH